MLTGKTPNLIIKWAKDMKKHVTEEDIQMAIKYTKRYSISAIWEVQIKTTMRYCYIPIIKSKI